MAENLWDLGAEPDSVRAVARTWRALADSVGIAWQGVGDAVSQTVGSAWLGDAADGYAGHAFQLGGDIDASHLITTSVASALDAMADLLVDAQQRLDTRLAELYEFVTALQRVFFDNPLSLALAEAQHAAIEAAHEDARQIRSKVDDALLGHLDTLDSANQMLEEVAGRWGAVARGESTGWTPPPEVTDRVMAIQVGDQLIVHLPDGAYPTGWGIEVLTDPETDEQVVKATTFGAETELYRAPAGAQLSVRTGAGEDSVMVRGHGITAITGDGDDQVTFAGGGHAVVTLGGDDTVEGRNSSRTGVSVSGGAGRDTIGESGFTINDESGRGVLRGGPGRDTMLSYDGGIRISGGEGSDDLTALGGANTVDGDAGRDRLSGGYAAVRPDGSTYQRPDVLRGGPGGDHIEATHQYHQQSDTVDGQGGHDRAEADREDQVANVESGVANG